jgi:hypothetical protein
MPIIPVHWRLMQEDREFEASETLFQKTEINQSITLGRRIFVLVTKKFLSFLKINRAQGW